MTNLEPEKISLLTNILQYTLYELPIQTSHQASSFFFGVRDMEVYAGSPQFALHQCKSVCLLKVAGHSASVHVYVCVKSSWYPLVVVAVCDCV
jgi:hypothetical protein